MKISSRFLERDEIVMDSRKMDGKKAQAIRSLLRESETSSD